MSAVCLGVTFSCELEPNNDFDSNEIRPLMNRLSREIATSSDDSDLYKSAGPMQCPSFINNVVVREASPVYLVIITP